MPKEAYARLNFRYQICETDSLAHEFTAPVPRISHTGGRVVGQYNINGAVLDFVR